MSAEVRRLDGYDTAEDAAAGYMTQVGFMRLAMNRAVKAIDSGDHYTAKAVLVEAERSWGRSQKARAEKMRPTLEAVGLRIDDQGVVTVPPAAPAHHPGICVCERDHALLAAAPVEAAEGPLRRKLTDLIANWFQDQATYPMTDAGNHAAAAVRCCAQELADTLSGESPASPSAPAAGDGGGR